MWFTCLLVGFPVGEIFRNCCSAPGPLRGSLPVVGFQASSSFWIIINASPNGNLWFWTRFFLAGWYYHLSLWAWVCTSMIWRPMKALPPPASVFNIWPELKNGLRSETIVLRYRLVPPSFKAVDNARNHSFFYYKYSRLVTVILRVPLCELVPTDAPTLWACASKCCYKLVPQECCKPCSFRAVVAMFWTPGHCSKNAFCFRCSSRV